MWLKSRTVTIIESSSSSATRIFSSWSTEKGNDAGRIHRRIWDMSDNGCVDSEVFQSRCLLHELVFDCCFFCHGQIHVSTFQLKPNGAFPLREQRSKHALLSLGSVETPLRYLDEDSFPALWFRCVMLSVWVTRSYLLSICTTVLVKSECSRFN